MGKDMSSVDNPMGFQPYGPVLRQRLYAVTTAPTIHIYHGDMIRHGGAALATKFGTMVIVEDGTVLDGASNTQKILGAVTQCFDEDMDPVMYIAALEAGDSTVAGYVMIADHPDQLYIAQEDGTTEAIDLADVGENCDIVSVTISAGTAATGLSTQELASDTVAAAAALDMKLHYPHPDDTVGDDTNCHCRWICSVNVPFYDVFHAGL